MKQKVFLPNLNGLRFIAALFVIISHIELNKRKLNLPNQFENVKHLGFLGVNFFFIISGFLITYLLLIEKEKLLKINIKSFYMRRILRIWPLYYFIILLSLFVLPYIPIFNIPNQMFEYNSKTLLLSILAFVFFLPNILIIFKSIPYCSQTWSIGTEEQFYIIWPHIINRVKNINCFFVLLIVAYSFFTHLINKRFLDEVYGINILRGFISHFQLNNLVIGALFANLFYHKKISCFIKNYIFILSVILLLIIIFFDYNFILKDFTISILFIFILLNLIANKSYQNLLENKVFFFLGKISYGLYMLHHVAIVLVIKVLFKLNMYQNVFAYTISILITIIFATLSYYYLEMPFLKMKNKFTYLDSSKD